MTEKTRIINTEEHEKVDELEVWEEAFTLNDETADLKEKYCDLQIQINNEKIDLEWKDFYIKFRKENPDAKIEEATKTFSKLKEREMYGNSLVVPSYKKEPYAIWDGKDPDPRACKNMTSILDIACEDARFYEAIESVEASIPENTTRARRGDTRYWGAWCNAMGVLGDKPLSPQNLLIFVVDHAEGFISEESQKVDRQLVDQGFKNMVGPHKWSVIIRRLATISRYAEIHQWPINPTKDKGFKAALRQLGKKYASNSQPKAITRNILIHILDNTTDSVVGKRDRALLTFMFGSGGRRRIEAEEALIEDLEDQGDCFLFHMQRSKTNKTGQSEPKPLAGLAAKHMRAWLSLIGESKGPLFRPITKSGIIKPLPLKGAFISRIVKKLCSKAGYDPKEFSAHSLRSGFVTQAAREGCSLPEVKALTGHRTDAMVYRYYQQGNVLRSKAGNLL